MARKPYPRNFFVIQTITNSWLIELTRKVMNIATELEKRVNEDE
jgi:hypothetical protein